MATRCSRAGLLRALVSRWVAWLYRIEVTAAAPALSSRLSPALAHSFLFPQVSGWYTDDQDVGLMSSLHALSGALASCLALTGTYPLYTVTARAQKQSSGQKAGREEKTSVLGIARWVGL